MGMPEPLSPNRISEQARLRWPVLVGGISKNCYLAATLYPNESFLRFTISLVFQERNISRLDYEPTDRIEINPPLAGHPFSLETIRGPHFHRWTENKHFASAGVIPETLPFRVPLVGMHNWDNAFRHFAGETNIRQPAQVPPWPRRERLI